MYVIECNFEDSDYFVFDSERERFPLFVPTALLRSGSNIPRFLSVLMPFFI
jgi:hypothetical protein